MNASSTVSVVITCYNLGEFLDEAVQSVLSQTYQDFEILIVDDGSTDEHTCDLLASYTRPKTRVLHTANGGLPAARNVGIRQTTGRFLCMLDADDCLEPTYMERSVQALQDDESLAFVSHWLRTFGDESWEWTPRDCELPAFLATNPINGAALFRRDAWSAAGGFDEAMREGLEDWDFWITLVEKGWRGRILPEFLFRYRRRKGSMSQLMMQNGTHARLYRSLIDKHPATFRQYLPVVLREVEQESCALVAHIDALEAEQYEWLGPELMSLRDDVAVLDAKVAERREHLEAEAQRARLVEERDALAADRARLADHHARVAADRDRLAAELDAAGTTARELTVGLGDARAEIDALHQSASWRLTRPLRFIYDWMLKRRRRSGARHG